MDSVRTYAGYSKRTLTDDERREILNAQLEIAIGTMKLHQNALKLAQERVEELREMLRNVGMPDAQK